MVDRVELTPTPEISATDYPFNVLHDVARLAPHGDTVFFRDFASFADGTPKLRPEECNLPGQGNALPAGYAKRIGGISIQVQGAQGDDLFEADILVSKQLQRTITLQDGIRRAAQVDPCVPLLGQEHFEVHVRAPDHLRERRAYARVTLHGTLSRANQVV